MTPEQIDGLNGRELDRAVAELVMGWTIKEEGLVYHDGSPYWFVPEWDDEMPHLSATISGAWLVVEKMQRDGWLTTIEVNPGSSYVVFFHPKKEEHCEGYFTADATSEAICKAALKAVSE